jgi:cellulose biosynthesis protein BcsQ
MTLTAFVSAKGSPGVSTTAALLAGIAPRPTVLADLDPVGGDVVLRHRDPAGKPLAPDRGLLSLGAALRRGQADRVLPEHLQVVSGGLEVLVGVTSPEQVNGLGPLWPQLAQALRAVPGRDVIADCGRLTVGSPALPVLTAADGVVLVTRPHLEHLAHLRERLRWLLETLTLGGTPVPVGVVLIAPERDRGAAAECRQLLDVAHLRATVLGTLAQDEKGAAILTGRSDRPAGRTSLVRSARALLPALYRHTDPSLGGDRR